MSQKQKIVEFVFVKEPEISLTQFIEDNQKILAVIGVLTALSVFWSNSSVKPLSSFISFLCLLATVPLFVEVWRKYIKANTSFLVVAFMYSITPLMGYTAWYVLVKFRPQWQTMMVEVITWVLFFLFAPLYDRLRITERIINYDLAAQRRHFFKISKWPTQEETEKAWRDLVPTLNAVKILPKFYDTVAAILILLICILPASLLAPVANRQLDKAYEKYAAEEKLLDSQKQGQEQNKEANQTPASNDQQVQMKPESQPAASVEQVEPTNKN